MCSACSVLIVDDEKFIREILRRTVSREGYQAEEAVDGADAVEKLKVKPYDFVISDIRMPNMTGLELLAYIKENHPDIIVLLITSYTGEFTAENALKAGADFFITKPFKNTEIAKALSALRIKKESLRKKPAKDKKPVNK